MKLMNPLMPASDRWVRENIPGAGGLPLLEQSLNFLHDPVGTFIKLYHRYGSVYWIGGLGVTGVVLMGPAANQFVLRNQDEAFSNNLGWEFFIGPFFKRGIMLLDFDEHRFHRGIMQAAFKKNILVEYLQRMNPAIAQGIARWQTGPGFKVFPHLKQLTLDIATDVFMGETLGPEADRINRAFIDCVLAGTALARFPVPGGRWRRGLQARKILEEFFRSRIASKRQQPGNDLFSRLCQAEDEEGKRFSDEDVINHMIFLMMAAHDTSTLTLCSMFYQLAKHPEWQEKLRAEVQAIGKPYPDFDDLGRLELTQQVMKESLRLIAPVHGIPRKTVKPVEFGGYRIPANTYVIVSPMATHHMAEWWPEPHRFDPERFSETRNEHKKHMYQFIPFGGGAHMCIGLHFAEMQIKAILFQVLQQFRWTVEPRYRMPINFTSLPAPADKLPVRLQRL